MFRIGDFSRISQVSITTLRYYDEVGLLKPLRCDEWTGYRYYGASQLPRLNRIMALKELGFTLEEVRQLLDEDLAVAELRGMLRLRRSELSRAISEEQVRLARVELRLKQIEMEGKMSEYDVLIKRVEPMLVVSARGVVPQRSLQTFAGAKAAEGDLVQEIGKVCDVLVPQVRRTMKREGAKQTGAMFLLYGQRDDDVELEMVVPVERPAGRRADVDSESPGGFRELEGAEQVAAVVHRGGYGSLLGAYSALGRWIEDNGYRVSGPCREIYLHHDPDGQPPAHVTEVQFPIEKR
jgi:DNA-binding transcriptional MerR regulator